MKNKYQVYGFLIVGALVVAAFWYINRYVKQSALSEAATAPPE